MLVRRIGKVVDRNTVWHYDVRRVMRCYVCPWLLNPDREIARRATLRGRHQRGYGRHSMRYLPRPRKILEPPSAPSIPDLPMPTDGTEASWLVEPSKPAMPEPPVQPPEQPTTTAELRLPFVPYGDVAVVDVSNEPVVTGAMAQISQEPGLTAR